MGVRGRILKSAAFCSPEEEGGVGVFVGALLLPGATELFAEEEGRRRRGSTCSGRAGVCLPLLSPPPPNLRRGLSYSRGAPWSSCTGGQQPGWGVRPGPGRCCGGGGGGGEPRVSLAACSAVRVKGSERRCQRGRGRAGKRKTSLPGEDWLSHGRRDREGLRICNRRRRKGGGNPGKVYSRVSHGGSGFSVLGEKNVAAEGGGFISRGVRIKQPPRATKAAPPGLCSGQARAWGRLWAGGGGPSLGAGPAKRPLETPPPLLSCLL